jgi:hypothetical protein
MMTPTMRASAACWRNHMRLVARAAARAKQANEDRRQRLAEAGGFFWSRCPKCGEDFGGNECSGGAVFLSHEATSGSLTCKNCPGDWVALFVPKRPR